MVSKYKLEIEVLLDKDDGVKAIDVAKTAYAAHGGVTALVDGNEQRVPAEQFITCTEQALMELVEDNPLFDEAGIVVDTVSCRREDPRPSEPEEPNISLEDELDEEDSGVYVCRWPNGDFSVVMAGSKREAIIALDEWGPADPSWLTAMDTCMIDFRLNSRGQIQLAQFGFETADLVWKACYPVLDRVRTQYVGDRSRKAIAEIKKAARHERTRLQGSQPAGPSASTEIGRELQRRLGATGLVADHYVEQFATYLLRSSTGKKAKPS